MQSKRENILFLKTLRKPHSSWEGDKGSLGQNNIGYCVSPVPDVSVIVPAYNEEESIANVLKRLSRVIWSSSKVEVVVVDDGSIDGTSKEIEAFPFVRCIRHSKNMGKGAAIRTGFRASRGKVVVIQDADLEYPPEHIPQLVKPVLSGEADVVFGSRFRGKCEGMSFSHLACNKLLSLEASLIFRISVTDIMTGHKVFSRAVVDSFELKENGFGVEVEMTSQSLQNGWRFEEVPIVYSYRDFGISKIGPLDGIKSFLNLLLISFKGVRRSKENR